ncbi:hypothetical protein D3C80_1828050 [compost metagenome]
MSGLIALNVGVRQVEQQHRVIALRRIDRLKASNGLSGLILTQIDVGQQVQHPDVFRIFCQQRLNKIARFVVFLGFIEQDRPAIFGGYLLANVAFAVSVQQVFAQTIAFRAVHAQRTDPR